ncbi:MAG: phosphoribosylanthranilate isomerase [Ichthyobacteriaceae bacterium]|nr:phosphoribosylanthranilate isomerase [Ichthyobacteriaceae bacterium]
MNKSKSVIKVCGMRNSENIKNLSKLDIDMMGMIFYPKSPRYVVDVPDFGDDFKGDKRIKKVGVFVNADVDFIEDKVTKFTLDVVQLHGKETPEECNYYKQKGLGVMKAFGINEGFNFDDIKDYEQFVDVFVFDSKTKVYGGSGKKFNWNKLKEYKGNIPFLLSGGIGEFDVEEVKKFTHKKQVGLDLNSGFEIEPALKNVNKLQEFINNFK